MDNHSLSRAQVLFRRPRTSGRRTSCGKTTIQKWATFTYIGKETTFITNLFKKTDLGIALRTNNTERKSGDSDFHFNLHHHRSQICAILLFLRLFHVTKRVVTAVKWLSSECSNWILKVCSCRGQICWISPFFLNWYFLWFVFIWFICFAWVCLYLLLC